MKGGTADKTVLSNSVRTALLFVAALGLGLSMSVSFRYGGVAKVQMRGERAAGRDMQSMKTNALAGETALEGEGIRIVIDDSKIRVGNGLDANRLLVHERHLLFLVNELFAAGAEGVSINGERIVAVSAIRCVGPAIRINDAKKVPPFEILVIGEKDVLLGAVTMMGGVVDSLSRQGMKVDVAKQDKVVIEPYKGNFKVEYARSKWE